ncbi:hypothetical protein BTA51_21295 [Hahella sp. CCB-MM4]|uniref:GspH/FimT family pseudopilin n=1 Tax=Hahella sp. (strain CCB-MM4) TaxID=1926491 RepID=UPI000B9BE4B2|nr:GspH/FimT family pseudopilin [Hahella sp. CCB-MM4]OZG71473.1 hypothetical protein BTA51_21295 [Hahella sp. CCB-MM4]
MKQTGVTLVELMLVITIIAIVLAFGVPSMNYIVDSGRLTANTNEFSGALNMARLEAVKRGRTIRISSVSGTTDWANGFRIWIDSDSDDTYDAGEEIRVFEAIDTGLTLTGTASSLSFRASGFTNMATGNTFTFDMCTQNASLTDREIEVNAAGRITVGDTGADC